MLRILFYQIAVNIAFFNFLGPFGGKNYFLSVAFIVVGVICLLIAAAFLIKKKISGDAFGEKKER